MLFLKGTNAITPFRANQVLSALSKVMSGVTEITAQFIYLVDYKDPLTKEDQDKLERLLQAKWDDEANYLASNKSELYLWVMPRLGTISPWSSKSTEIAKISELKNVERIERGICYHLKGTIAENPQEISKMAQLLFDPLLESVFFSVQELRSLFHHTFPASFNFIPLLEQGITVLNTANKEMGLALNEQELQYLYDVFNELKRNPTDVELVMFSQINSEHCRHKIFNAKWQIDGVAKPRSLFSMIRNTHEKNPNAVLVAYKDNAAVMAASTGHKSEFFFINPKTKIYETHKESLPYVLKAETHNHPTAISPFPGAATGSGGEIRDEDATGRGSAAKAGVCGFSVSHLQIPNFSKIWELNASHPSHMATPLQIMLEGPIGAASYNNEFGRPNICGYFRTFEMNAINSSDELRRGYHKPIMIAGGIGYIRESLVEKYDLPVGALLIVLGGPSMAIGLGGGSASSLASGESSSDLDFASVQRANPEMQRRCHEVIQACVALNAENPILSIHDVGAGGLSNALPELVAGSNRGAEIDFRKIPNSEPGMTPLQIWCNEAQERFVLAIEADKLPLFEKIAERERCCFAVVGRVREDEKFIIFDSQFDNFPVDIPLSILFQYKPTLLRISDHVSNSFPELDCRSIQIDEAVKCVLQFPCVAAKNFLITIGDRSVGGMVTRDQMVGPWQTPVSDVAVTCSDFSNYAGQAIAMGERTPLALIDPAIAARMTVAEAVTNIAAASIEDISHVVLSANWMAAADLPGEGAALYDAVEAIGMELCPALEIAVPVGKDSLSMKASWKEHNKEHCVAAPLSLIITAAANVNDVRRTLTPQLQLDQDETLLVLIDLGNKRNALGGSVLAQVYQQLGRQAPDLDDPKLLKRFFSVIQALNRQNYLLAYHDRSDGGLFVTLCEMMFASHVGLDICLDDLGDDPLAALFGEELGAVIQIRKRDRSKVFHMLEHFCLADFCDIIAEINPRTNNQELIIRYQQEIFYQNSRVELQRFWAETSYHMQSLRDHKDSAKQEYDLLLDEQDPGLSVKLTFDIEHNIGAPYIHAAKPKVAILREQGVNGHVEMAAAFDHAGFQSIDVHMSDLLTGRIDLKSFVGLAACGGFSYGDVLGAGRGWAQSILWHPKVLEEFSNFFHRPETFSLGICNGCQMFSHLKTIIPGAESWPTFMRNQSEQFEARLSLVEVLESPSLFFKGMEASILPVVISHGEGRAVFETAEHSLEKNSSAQRITLRYVDSYHQATEKFPSNPNGSPGGATGFTSSDGRVTILMPHPERVFRTVQNSWHPKEWKEYSPWMHFFRNARVWVG